MTAAWAPGRVNIIGEHTDYNDGLVLPMAVHFGTTARVTRRRDDVVAIESAQVPGHRVELPLDELAPGRLVGWAAYPAGALWSLGREHGIPTGLDILIDGDVPLGAGLSSSAAVECAVILAVASEFGLDADRRSMAEWAQRAENDFVGVPTGSMDQVASMMSVDGHALLFDVEADTIKPVALQLPGVRWMVVDTHARHELVDGGYADRRRACERAAQVLEVPSLRRVRDVDEALTALMMENDGAMLAARARHVVSENDRVLRAVDVLSSGDVVALGALLSQSHASLRDDFEVSCPELDAACDAALSAGALGARMTGGGFGGSALALVPLEDWDATARAIAADFGTRGLGVPDIIAVEAGSGAHIVD